MGNLKENLYVDEGGLRFNTNLNELEYRNDSGTWLPAAPVAPPFVPTGTTVGSDHRTAVAANFGPITLYTITTPGMYQINYYIVNTVTGGGADAVGQLVFNYPDSSGGNAAYASMPSGINATLLGNGTYAAYMTAGAITYTLGSFVGATSLRMEISATATKM